MARSRFILLAAATLLLAGSCAVKETLSPVEAPSYGTLEVSLDQLLTKASLVSTAGGKTVVWDMDDLFRIYNVADASYVEVKPVSIGSDGFTVTLPLPYPADGSTSIVVTYGGTEFRADSTLTAASPIAQPLLTDGHDCGAMPMGSAIIPLENKDTKVVLSPLNALVEVELLRIPNSRTDKIRNIHLEISAKRGTRSNQLTCDAYCYKVDRDGFSLELEDYMSDKYIFDGEYASYIELSGSELLTYSTSPLTLYFLSPGFVQPQGDPNGTLLQSIKVDVTTDKNIITQELTGLDDKRVKFTAGRISHFAVNMNTATVTARKGLSVEWSPGYLRYDAATKGYGFAGPEERGLYFKIGSVMGFDPFASTPAESYFGHSRKFGAWKYDENGTISFTDYYNIPWEEGTADMAAFRKDESGDIVPFRPSSWADFEYVHYAEGVTYDRARHDPCAYVRDGHGDWRLPTRSEMLEIVDVIGESLGNWKVWSLGSETINTTDNLPHMISVTDKDGQRVVFSTTSSISNQHSFSEKDRLWSFYVELGYSESIYLPSSQWRAEIKSSGRGAVDAEVLAITSLTSLRCQYENDARTFYSLSANELTQGAEMVRCVRSR